LAEEELRRKKVGGLVKGYINQCHTDLIALLIDGIQRVNFEDEDDDSDEWGVASSSGCCLGYVS